MSQSRELQLHIAQMEEIRSILNAMKNLALIEIHKLGRFQTMQGQAVINIENAAMDFLDFYPLPVIDKNALSIGILVGAERGFCGDFNESLLDTLNTETYAGIIAIGSRLGNRLADNSPDVIATIAGANVAEEVPIILNRLIDTISLLSVAKGDINKANKTTSTLQLTVTYHDNSTGQITRRQILPPFSQQQQRLSAYGNPPLLNLEPDDFFADLVDHYLFAVLHEIFYLSLMAENQRRLQHLEGAVKHLDDETVNLRRKSQIYRQEEITEEIEVILLNSEIN
ncbi:F0F1 ATP synthase subunit gamma [Methylobacter psychrophilus]|uniref:F0F1 ATP synthase subunit gamma n=1 Tax=Methylobacter psychrophilus TaxID=96941 RepID=UPI0021D4D07F|nr:F0F1 ATP synthase subunit gamma [Methylobacter psychrophilus]